MIGSIMAGWSFRGHRCRGEVEAVSGRRDPGRFPGHRHDDIPQQSEALDQIRLIDLDEFAVGVARCGAGPFKVRLVDHAPVVLEAVAGCFQLVERCTSR